MKTLRLLRFCVFALTLAVPAGFVQAAPGAASSKSQPQSSTSKKKTKKKSKAKRQPSQKAPTADRITEIQSALARGGYYQGDPNGKWDANTVDALQRFQSTHGIEASGKLDAATLQKLGLGSDIAGVSAPHKPQPGSPSAPAAQPGAPQSSAPAPAAGSAVSSGALTAASASPANK